MAILDTSSHTNDHKSLLNLFRQGNRALTACAAVLCVLFPFLVLLYIIDQRTVLDTNVWIKPLKFDVALIIYALTLSLYSNYLPSSWQRKGSLNLFVSLVVFSILAEMLWLVAAAAIGEPSHFNNEHTILRLVYPLMGILATILTALSLVIGIGILRNSTSKLNPALRYSLGAGLILTFVLTMVTAGYLAGSPGHAVTATGTPDETDTVFLLGWLRSAGDLRVAHFFATHALHAVPLMAWLIILARPKLRSIRHGGATILALVLSAGYTLLVGFAFLQAISARPFL